MPDPTVYFNGSFVPQRGVAISPDDRGYHFGDGIYEVLRLYAGRPFAPQRHAVRLARSLQAIDIPVGDLADELTARSVELAQRNGLDDALIYWQVTRGVTPRAHAAPPELMPTVYATATPATPMTPTTPMPTGRLITHPDRRWADCWIKSLQLLPNTLAKTEAKRRGAAEAVLHRDDTVTEGASTTVFAVRDGVLRTHPLDGGILPGVTRAVLLEACEELGVAVCEQAVSVEELLTADEVFIAGTGTQLLAATEIDDRPIGDAPGPITQQLWHALRDAVMSG